MGNSEVGHNALGCGQIYSQGAKLVNESIESGKMYNSEAWKEIISNVKENGGVDGLRNFIIDTVKPYIEKIIAQEKLTGISTDYNDILRGLISSCIVELQLQQLTKDKFK